MFARIKQSRSGQIIKPPRSKDAVGTGVVEVPDAQDNAVQSDGGSVESPKANVSRQETAPLRMPLGGWDPIGVRPRFGSYRGLARLMLAHLESVAGRFSGYQQIRWEKVRRIVFVCHGNICRSPYAERRAATYGLTVASFGLSADAGMPADPTACRIAARRAIELAPHRAQDIKDFEFRRGDLLAAMETRQVRELGRAPPIPCQLTLLGLWGRPRRPHIHDPHRLGEGYWEQCFDVIDSAVLTIAEKMRGSLLDEK